MSVPQERQGIEAAPRGRGLSSLLFVAAAVALFAAFASYIYVNMLVVGTFLAISLASLIAGLALGPRPDLAVAKPIARTPDGAPVYQVVGYTADGRPITADQAVGYQPFNPKSNSMAVIALVLGVVIAPLAVPFGHIARSQIRRTGEQGSALALAGLILGYLGLAGLVVGVVIVLANM
jgi:hypothetical protein